LPRYFFNYRDGVESLDDEGVVLAGIPEARALAIQSSGEALRDLGESFWADREWKAWITDESGATVCSLLILANPQS
jgi:hypothetical protein